MSHGERSPGGRYAVVMPAVETAASALGTDDEADPSGLLAGPQAFGRGGAMKTRLALTYESSRDSPPYGADDTLKAVLPSRNMSVPQLQTAVAHCMSLGLYSG
jgi:hypothetical protein